MGRFTGDTKDPAVNVSTWFLLVTASLSVIFRLGTKYGSFRTLTNDDYLIVVSLIFCIGQSIAVSMAVANGYGYHYSTLTPERFDNMMKSQYAAALLYIPSLYFSKISLSCFIRNLTPTAKDHRVANLVQISVTVMALICLLGTSFQCSVPQTWNYYTGKCMNLIAWHYFTGIMNIVTDTMITSQALYLIARIQTSWKRKFVFASIFLSRVLVILVSIVELILVSQNDATHDPSFSTWGVTISVETIQCLSIVTACWAQLKPFLNMLKSNGLRIQGVDYRSTNNRSKWSTTRSANPTESKFTRSGEHELMGMGAGQGNITTVSAARLSDEDSQSSQAGIIREVRTWVVSEEVES
ncbi:uncharacterized protein BO88DRAFT_408959 [Aspergillus vadensis CBS 113365]|uniref:Rhodopsin domain-containing protein n=1 Tax=Aspergillus vadensis (strain CBS 113365 / IMI 142717 / IBT 24658) TaxID=1448311 RepID=A0A319B0U7_ASPVC|nr:hypothetical protein BO88DRAFT_408959 [Aspergillus vadensis CBS 113365]PYH63790.1 hypothetical protein BO88DRAFT_408959 [Aspergillus vadensis CBS 113365]